jgi:MYXO-CTERM domain-containing protein
VLIAGWGQQTVTASQFEAPPPGTVGVKVCAESFVNEVGTHEMQIGADSTTSRKCHGDSGGPTFMDIETDHARSRRLVGVTSHAYDAEDCNKGGVDTRVDAWIEWIDTEMFAACDNGTRSWCEVKGVIDAGFYDPPTPADQADASNGVTPPGANLLGGCSHTGSGDGEGSEPTFAGVLTLLGLAFLRRRRS